MTASRHDNRSRQSAILRPKGGSDADGNHCNGHHGHHPISYCGRLGRPLHVPKQQVGPAGSWCAYPSRLACLMRDIGWRNFSMLPVLVVSDALGEHFSPPWNSASPAQRVMTETSNVRQKPPEWSPTNDCPAAVSRQSELRLQRHGCASFRWVRE